MYLKRAIPTSPARWRGRHCTNDDGAHILADHRRREKRWCSTALSARQTRPRLVCRQLPAPSYPRGYLDRYGSICCSREWAHMHTATARPPTMRGQQSRAGPPIGPSPFCFTRSCSVATGVDACKGADRSGTSVACRYRVSPRVRGAEEDAVQGLPVALAIGGAATPGSASAA